MNGSIEVFSKRVRKEKEIKSKLLENKDRFWKIKVDDQMWLKSLLLNLTAAVVAKTFKENNVNP